MTTEQPIGIFDSGFGGLSVFQAIQKQLPHENIIFVADFAGAPWGDRSTTDINARIDYLISFLIKKHIKALVIACNTATALAIDRLRQEYSFPIIGIEPAILPAIKQTKTGNIGVFATTRTIQSRRYQQLKKKLQWTGKVYDIPTPGLADLVEKGLLHTPRTQKLIQQYWPANQNIDQLVLGCTHYPFLARDIQKVIGASVKLHNPAPAVAQQLQRQLEKYHLQNQQSKIGSFQFFGTEVGPLQEKVLQTLLQNPLYKLSSLPAYIP